MSKQHPPLCVIFVNPQLKLHFNINPRTKSSNHPLTRLINGNVVPKKKWLNSDDPFYEVTTSHHHHFWFHPVKPPRQELWRWPLGAVGDFHTGHIWLLIYKALPAARGREYIYVLIFADRPPPRAASDGATPQPLLPCAGSSGTSQQPVLYSKFNFQLQHTWQGRSRKMRFCYLLFAVQKF